jgi:hypothetical protein
LDVQSFLSAARLRYLFKEVCLHPILLLQVILCFGDALNRATGTLYWKGLIINVFARLNVKQKSYSAQAAASMEVF